MYFDGAVLTTGDGAVLTIGDGAVLTIGDGAVLTIGYGAVLTWGRFDRTPAYVAFQNNADVSNINYSSPL